MSSRPSKIFTSVSSTMEQLGAALGFLTCLPVPARHSWSVPGSTGVAFFPVVGMLLGFILWLTAALSMSAGLPAMVATTLTWSCWILTTGAFHLDGLMDTVDGLAGSRDRVLSLRIMKDSRTGPMGVVAAVIVLLWKWVLLLTLIELPVIPLPLVLILIPAWSRWGMVLALARFPSARPTGLGYKLQPAARKALLPASLLVFVATVGGMMAAPAAWVGLVLLPVTSIGIVYGLGTWWSRRLDGLTGDTYGALNELSEVLALLVMLIAY